MGNPKLTPKFGRPPVVVWTFPPHENFVTHTGIEPIIPRPLRVQDVNVALLLMELLVDVCQCQ